ncbi:MAG: DNA (cytosine-5-)-methyltransferase [Gemmatimonadaceae bacterium]|nr:DNA (cytosine-5-)-methyltransferase [Gemmatimonadaceae bacterium]
MIPTEEKTAIRAVRKALKYWTQAELASRLGVHPRTVRRWVLGEARPKYSVAKAIEHELERDERPRDPSFSFIDLFAGIGGLRRGFEAQNGRCVFTSEWDQHAVRTYKANFPDSDDIHGDITKLPPANVPDHDVLLAGFPCQPFSLAGVSKKNSLGRAHGFRDKAQGTLFFNVVKILEAKHPKAFLLENVKNLKSHDGGRTYQVITGALRELGYHVFDRVIDARPWVPQRRERIFIVGFAEAVDFSFDEVQRPRNCPTLGDILHAPTETPEPPYSTVRRGDTVVDPRYTLSDHLWQYLQDYAARHRAKGNGFGCSVFRKDDVARTLSARYHKDGSEILIAQQRQNPRRLTPRECARLMGFDAPGRPPMQIPVSDTQAYRQFGNSVVVPVIESIAKVMIPRVLKPEEHPPVAKMQQELQFDEHAA